MRRPSIPFEAIGPGYRRRLKALNVGTTTHRALETQTMSDPKKDPTQVPDTLKDNVGQIPQEVADQVELEDDEDEMDDDDSTGFDDDDE